MGKAVGITDEIIAIMILEEISQRQKARAKEEAEHDVEAEGVLRLLLAQILKEKRETEILTPPCLADISERLEVVGRD